ncbi:MAG: imidazole glycerol phosphate synthase subunit HisH [Anaerolineae bacterium]|nr:imidazole glycerol phosphate synthase subunit HisH [Anaerolineae bacterium]
MIALIDYGAGNVRSVHKALVTVGAEVTVTQDPAVVLDSDKVVLPGVGAFSDCMRSLERLGLIPSIYDAVARGKPFLGICVGMQVLFDEGTERGTHAGLGLLPGRVVKFAFPSKVRLKVPHTGWNQIEATQDTILLADLPDGAWAYFNHGYYCQAKTEHTLAVTDYGGPCPCLVGKDNIFGIQFHPEKSQQTGLHILRNFING